ncbi:hypothetical protein EXN22_11770 [Pseudomonas tructae]|uniref:Uncharacterized protein n=1 Tax=Pseudomonas tructae TaxID=2518644 RepID=A0A411MHL5_9PSED|nr:hypothetical protein [Pseudomonas tructae]QBF26338.1 hypothetical protein EXN22_11770 [Pseudomonas tructae]
MLDAKHLIIRELCFGQQENASELTRQLHFRAQQPPPAPPSSRPVNNAENFSEEQINIELTDARVNHSQWLFSFGRALHGWQDTYAHTGISQHYPPCAEQWVWTHAEERGGALFHQADRTHVYPFDCQSAAQTTFGYLLDYRKTMPPPAPVTDWGSLREQVFAFCQLKTRTDKFLWLQAHAVPQARAIAGNISLSDGEQSFFSAPPIDLRPPRPVLVSTLAAANESSTTPRELDKDSQRLLQSILKVPIKFSPQARQWAEEFLQAWLTSPPEQLPQALARFFAEQNLTINDPNIDKLLRLRMTDRGRTDEPDFPPEKYFGAKQGFIRAEANNWRILLVPPRGQETPALVDEQAVGNFNLIAILRQAPNAVLIIRTRPGTEGYVIEDLQVQVFH